MKRACTLVLCCKCAGEYAISLMMNCLFCHHRQQLVNFFQKLVDTLPYCGREVETVSCSRNEKGLGMNLF